MRAVIQRVKESSVAIKNEKISRTGAGLLVLLAIHRDDSEEKLGKMADKIVNLRIFPDGEGKMNRSLLDTGGEMMIVSQFTLYGDCRKGKRPGFTDSARPEKAIPMYEKFVSLIRDKGIKTATGEFGAEMAVALTNDGPVTLIIDI